MPAIACEGQVSYFKPQMARKPGLRTNTHGLASTNPLSQKAGRVNNVFVLLTRCLTFGVHSTSVFVYLWRTPEHRF